MVHANKGENNQTSNHCARVAKLESHPTKKIVTHNQETLLAVKNIRVTSRKCLYGHLIVSFRSFLTDNKDCIIGLFV